MSRTLGSHQGPVRPSPSSLATCLLPWKTRGSPNVTLLTSARFLLTFNPPHSSSRCDRFGAIEFFAVKWCYGEEDHSLEEISVWEPLSRKKKQTHWDLYRAMAGIATKVCKSWGRNLVPDLPSPAATFFAVRHSNVDARRGVGPVKGPENDPATRGSTPDDSRADEVHKMEPKDVTKQKVAKAQEEPSGLQGSKLMPGFDSPVNPNAKPQSTTVDEKH